MSILNNIQKNVRNIPGWRTGRKIVVIESDDWGSIRMSSKKAYDHLVGKGVPIKNNYYCKYDGLASEDDLSALFEVLTSVKDKNNRHATFTAVSVVANPDFRKIEESGFTKYHFEPFTETLKNYPHHKQSFNLWREGKDNNIFIPQFHGREHLNVLAWLKALQSGNKDTLESFHYNVYGITPRDYKSHIKFQAAFDFDDASDIAYHKTVIEEGLNLFEEIFESRASYFIPTNGPFNNILEKTAAEGGIKYMGTSKIQHEPIGKGKVRKVFHKIGQKNKFGQIYLTRNAFFEPCNLTKDWVSSCLQDIKIAFFWKKPVVISSHRVNYIGSIIPQNRINGLSALKILLDKIVKLWPDVEFMSSVELGDLIKEETLKKN
jgi:hypothetical protein